jgi:hypothetical protein
LFNKEDIMADLGQFFSMIIAWAGIKAGYFAVSSITGWFAPEWVAGILRNRWLACNGIAGWHGTDFTYI